MSELTGTVVTVEQAIFTSIRGPTGEGYRIVACSPGLRAEEKVEITRFCPSHDSLCDASPTAEALLAWALASGRYAIACARHAGQEHTGRGGPRVYTHVAVLGAEAYRAFGRNPVRVRAAITKAVPAEPDLKPAANLQPLSLSVAADTLGLATALSFSRIQPEQACGLAGLLAGRGRLVVADGTRPLDTLQWAIDALPTAFRPTISLSVGLKFSPGRRLQFVWTVPPQDGIQRLTAGQDMQVLQPAELASGEAFAPAWFRLVRHCWNGGRYAELQAIAGDETLSSDPSVLCRTAELKLAVESVASANRAELATMQSRWAAFAPAGEVDRCMLQELAAAIQEREARLDEQDHEAALALTTGAPIGQG